jgi:hypothetical protein
MSPAISLPNSYATTGLKRRSPQTPTSSAKVQACTSRSQPSKEFQPMRSWSTITLFDNFCCLIERLW